MQFHLDTIIKPPVIVPGNREVLIVSNPLITVSFPDELGEYTGDTHPGVTIVLAKLDGVDVVSGFTAESSSTWSFRPQNLSNGEHTFEVIGRDDAGNIHTSVVRVFNVLAPAATATPVPTETPTPAPTLVPAATSVPDPTSIPVDPGDSVVAATPDPADPPPEATPEVTPEPAATPESVPTPEPTAEPENSEFPAAPEDAGQSVDPEQVPPPEEDNPDAAAAENPDADSEAPAVDPDSEGDEAGREDSVTEDDLAATVAAMRAIDDEAVEGEENQAPEEDPVFTVFGCNIPLNGEEATNAVSAGGDYLIAAAGLFGLIVARVRPGRRKRTLSPAR